MALVFPPPALCTGALPFTLSGKTLGSNETDADNAAMIASVGLGRMIRGRVDAVTIMQKAKWTIEECESDFE